MVLFHCFLMKESIHSYVMLRCDTFFITFTTKARKERKTTNALSQSGEEKTIKMKKHGVSRNIIQPGARTFEMRPSTNAQWPVTSSSRLTASGHSSSYS